MPDLRPPKAPPLPTFQVSQPEFNRARRYNTEDYKGIFDGTLFLPNFEPLPIWQVAGMAASFYGELREGAYAKLPGDSIDRPSYRRALYLLTSSQGGGWTGEGHIIASSGWSSDGSHVVAGSFAICKHQKVEGHGANHSRGWHPGHCGKCGLNMNVDSGD